MNIKTTDRRTFIKTTATAALGATLAQEISMNAQTKGKRIGFVDFDLNNYHANVFLKALREPLAPRGFTVAGATGMKTAESRAWAEKNNVPYFDNDAALNEAVDFYMILAPSNPEVHLELCQRFFRFGKATYVDKTFAPDLATARKIFELADKHNTAIQTSSALRYTNVQEEVEKAAPTKVKHMTAWGGGSSFDEYAIHPLELLISVMGHEVTGLMRRGGAEGTQLLIEFAGQRMGTANVFPKTTTPFAASLTTDKATRYIEVDVSKIFVNNQAGVLDFFEAGKPLIDRRESLTIMWMLDASRDPRAMKEFVRP